MKKLSFLIIYMLLANFVFCQTNHWQVVRKDILNAVVQVESNGFTGTAFILSDSAFKNFYLVTNKHVIGKYIIGDSVILNNKITVTFYGENYKPYSREINLKTSSGTISDKVKVHPDKLVDVAVIKLNVENVGNVVQKSIPFEFLRGYNNLQDEDVGLSLGSGVFAVGYPNGLKNVVTNEPVVKFGFISSDIPDTSQSTI